MRQRTGDDLTQAKLIPAGYEVDLLQHLLGASSDPSNRPLDMVSLAAFLYDDEAKTGPLLEIPGKFTDGD